MSNVNQLLAKAMSTTSEEEAMSCLRMARKKGKSFDVGGDSGEYNGHSAKYWYEKAALYYNKAKEKSDGLSLEQQNQLFRMYKNAEDDRAKMSTEKRALEKEVYALKNSNRGWWKFPVIMVQAMIIVLLLQMIG